MADIVALHPPADDRVPSTLFGADEHVNVLIPGGQDLDFTVRFGDDIWDLRGHRSWREKAGTQTKLNFTSFGPRWRDAAKEMALLLMDPQLAVKRAPHRPMAQSWPDIQEPALPVTAQGNLKLLRYALAVIDTHGIQQFDSDDWDRVQLLLVQPSGVADKRAGTTLAASTGRGRAQQLITLWQTTQISDRNGLLGRAAPFDGRETTELFRRTVKRNSVRPHEGVGHVLGFAGWVFDHVAEDIVSHLEWWAQNTTTEVPLTRDDQLQAMLDLVVDVAERNDGRVPGSLNKEGNVTLAHAPLARLVGVYNADDAFDLGRWVMAQLGGTVELALEVSPCPLPITEVPTVDGEMRPWISRLIASKESLDIWQRRLAYYAMFYLAATVMLRDSQLAVLSVDPIRTEQIDRPNGTSYVKHTLSAHKTKNRHAYVPTEVVVNGRVAHVIALLQRVAVALDFEPRRSDETGLLCLLDQRLATPLGKRPRVDARPMLHLDQSFLKVLREGAVDLHERGLIARNLADVQQLSMRQVRITCAQAYAVREHGQALAAAFGQWDTRAVAAGYVGDVYKLITPVDPDEARDLAQEDIGRRLVRAATNRDTLTGAGLGRLDDTLETHKVALSNPQPLTPARLKALGRRSRNVEQGPLTLCLYQPEGALCGGKGKPDFRLCLPGQCRNSVMSEADRARYELMRRQHLALNSDVLRRAADKMHDANPDIAEEFRDTSDTELHQLVKAHLDGYIAAALEDRA